MKRLIILSLGLVWLSLTVFIGIQVGSQSVHAQSPAQAVALAHIQGFDVAITASGDTYEKGIETGGVWASYGNIFGGAGGEAADIDVVDGAVVALASNGDVYEKSSSTGWNWTFTGNIFGSPTAVRSTTWGAIKAQHK